MLDKDGNSPLYKAVSSTSVSSNIVKDLFDAGADTGTLVQCYRKGNNTCWYPCDTSLLRAIKNEDLKMIHLLLDNGATINGPQHRLVKRTPLQKAAEVGNLKIVQPFMTRGADVNAPPAVRGGATALQLAAIGGYIGIVVVLLDNGANVFASAARMNGRTALEGAAEHGQIDMIKVLFNATKGKGFGPQQHTHAIKFTKK